MYINAMKGQFAMLTAVGSQFGSSNLFRREWRRNRFERPTLCLHP